MILCALERRESGSSIYDTFGVARVHNPIKID